MGEVAKGQDRGGFCGYLIMAHLPFLFNTVWRCTCCIVGEIEGLIHHFFSNNSKKHE